MFLSNYLQRIGNTGRKDAGIGDGEPADADALHIRSLEQEHANRTYHRHHQALDAVQPKPIQIIAGSVYEDDLYRKSEGTAQQQDIADVDLGNTGVAQQVQACYSQSDAEPDTYRGIFLEEKSQNGDKHDVHCGKKTTFSG